MILSAELLDILRNMLMVAFETAGPILFASMMIGIIIAVFQAATQIHEQTVTFVPKLLLISLLLVGIGSNMLELLQEFTQMVFSRI